MDNLTIKKSTFRWLALAAGLIVISLGLLLFYPRQSVHAQESTQTPTPVVPHIYIVDVNSVYGTGTGPQMGCYAGDEMIGVVGGSGWNFWWLGVKVPGAAENYASGNTAYYAGRNLDQTDVFELPLTLSWNDNNHVISDGKCGYGEYGACGDTWVQLASSSSAQLRIQYACKGYEGQQPTTPTPTPTPDPDLSCKVEGQNITMDLVPGASVTGSLSAAPYDYSTPGDLIDVITFYLANTIPLTYGSPGQARQGTIKIDLAGANILYIDSWINDTFVPTSPTELNYIPIDGGQTTQAISYVGYVHRSLANFSPDDTPRITKITIQYTAANDGTQLICDGGMTKSVSESPWQRTNDEEFGRGWMDWFGAFNGAPACDPGQQSIANQGYTGVGSRGQYSPVKQAFEMPAGSSTLNWKFRYRSRPEASWLGLYPGTPNVYITDASGAVMSDLIGSVNYDPGFIAPDWELITGSLSLSPGKYFLVLNQGYKYDGGGNPDLAASGQIYYDDVQLTTGAIDPGCSDWVSFPPEILPTATPTQSPTPTATGTQPTPTPTPTSKTLMPTPSRTPTLRSTPTRRSSVTSTKSRTPGPSSTLAATVTQHWISTTGVPANATPVISTTVTQPGWNPGLELGPPSDDNGNYPGTNPGTGQVNCERPTSNLAFAWWLDYERCLIMASVAWGPSQSATMVALPGFMTTKEPFNTVYQISHGLSSMSTQAAAYNWSDTGLGGINTAITPDPRFIFSQNLADPGGASPGNPWANGGTINLTLGGNGSRISAFSLTCNTRLSNMMAARLSEGLCFFLNITRSMGYLGWVQFLANCSILFGIMRLFLGLIRYYSFFGQPKATNSKTEVEE